MNKHASATLPAIPNYDECRITSCLKSLFTNTKSKVDADFIVRNHVADVKKELELINKEDTLELSYAYLSSMERSMPATAFRYVVIRRNNEPVLFAYFQLFTLTSRNFNLEKNRGFVKHILRFFLDLKKISVLISGNATRNDTAGYCFNETILSADEAVEIVAAAGEKIAVDEKASALILKDISASGDSRTWFENAGFETPWKDMVMTMDINSKWTTLADYTAGLSRKYKARAKKILVSGSMLTIKEITGEKVNEYGDEIFRLFKNVTENQSFVLANLEKDHFPMLKKLYKNNFEIVGLFRGKQLIAFFAAFVTTDAYELYHVGFDYQLNNEYQLYFNILFSGLDRAILLKKRQLKLGRTSFDAKASLGAKPVEMDYFYKTGNIPGVVSNWFANYFSSMEDAKWKLRNPLREQ